MSYKTRKTEAEMQELRDKLPAGCEVIDMRTCEGIVIILGKEDEVEHHRGGRFESDLSHLYEDETTDDLDEVFEARQTNNQIKGLERMILALACNGVHMTNGHVEDSIDTVLDAIGNE